MKNLFLSCLFLLPNIAAAGPRVIGNGGDVYALQFVTLADKVLAFLQSSPPSDLDLVALAEVIQTTSVESTKQPLSLNNLPKDAINYPSMKKIIFNRTRWSSFIIDEKLALVLHEYLGLIGIEDASYKFSRRLLGNFRIDSKIMKGSDSTWLLCQEDSLVLNSFEHRKGADTRATDIVLILGGFVFQGHHENKNTGEILLTDNSKKRHFTGEINFNYENDTVFIKGVLELNDELLQLDTTMKCEQKNRP